MLYFENDYCEGAHPAILQKLTETNFEKVSGTAPTPTAPAQRRRSAPPAPAPRQMFSSSRAAPRPTPSSSPPRSAAGRASSPPPPAMWPVMRRVHRVHGPQGHRPAPEERQAGRATVEDFCKTFYADSNHDHMVFPGMVYISHPTEYGTLYSKAELEALSAVCHTYICPLRGRRTSGLCAGERRPPT